MQRVDIGAARLVATSAYSHSSQVVAVKYSSKSKTFTFYPNFIITSFTILLLCLDPSLSTSKFSPVRDFPILITSIASVSIG